MIGASTTLTPRTWVSADENQEQAAARAAGMHRDGSAIAAVIALEPAHYLDTLDTNHCPSLAETLSLWVTFGSYLPWSKNLFLPSQSLSRRSKPQVQYRKFKNTMELDIPMRQPGADEAPFRTALEGLRNKQAHNARLNAFIDSDSVHTFLMTLSSFSTVLCASTELLMPWSKTAV